MTKDEALKLALEALENFARFQRMMMDGPDVSDKLLAEDCAEAGFLQGTKAITAIREALAQPEFAKHEVENADDWSEWVCPDPKSYLMKCCDCGLVHEAQFKVVRYKSDAEHEDCDPVDDPNVQAVFRMRRSEQWTPKDTAYRPGGLAQPEQKPVLWVNPNLDKVSTNKKLAEKNGLYIPLYAAPLHQLVSNTDELPKGFVPLEQAPAAWMYDWIAYGEEGETVIRDWISADYDESHSPTAGCHNIRPLYTTPPHRKPLTWERVLEIGLECSNDRSRLPFEVKVARAVEAAHGIKE